MVKKIFFGLTRLLFYLRCLFRSNISCQGKIDYYNSTLLIHRSGSLTIAKGVTMMNCKIEVGSNSRVDIGDACMLKNVQLIIGDNATITLGAGVIMNYTNHPEGFIWVSSGHLTIDEKANLLCAISVRFGATLKIGRHTGIGFNTEIVCDDSIEIGSYGLISNNIDIFDTNSHSLDYLHRRERIDAGYPGGCSEIAKPSTAPVKIGDDVWIGKRSIILKGCTIGNRCVVGMGTKVTPGVYPDDAIIVNEKSKHFASHA